VRGLSNLLSKISSEQNYTFSATEHLRFKAFFFFFLFVFKVLGIEPKALQMLGKLSTSEHIPGQQQDISEEHCDA
jgi:hypothetical protein